MLAAFAIVAIPFEESDAAAPAKGTISVSDGYSDTLTNSTIGNVLWVEDGKIITGYANKISPANSGSSLVDAYNETWPTDAPKRGYAIIFSIFSDASSADNYVHFMSQGKVKTAQANDTFKYYDGTSKDGKGLTVLYYLPESATAGQTVTGTFTYTIDNSSFNPESLTDAKTIEYSVELIDVVVKTGAELLGTEVSGKYTVTLDKDYVLSSYMEVPDGKELALNLNGHKLYANGIAVTTATNKNATISINGETRGSSIIAASYPVFFDYGSGASKLTVKGGTYTGSYGMVFYTTDGASASCEFDGITVDARNAGLWFSNKAIDSVSIKNCDIDAGNIGIYAGTVKKLTIENTDVAAGNTGIEIKAGEVAIKGGSIYSEIFNDSSTQVNNNGSGAGVDALVINNGYTSVASTDKVSVKVEGTAITNGESNTPVLIIAGILKDGKSASAVPISFETDSQTIDQIAVKKADGGADVTVKTKGGESTADASKVEDLFKDNDEVSLIVTEDKSDLKLNVPAGKKLVINAAVDGKKLNGDITTGSGNGAQTISLRGVVGEFIIEKGSVIVKNGTISAGTITVDEGDVLVLDDVVIAGNVTIDGKGTVMVKAGQKVTINNGFTLTVGAYMEVYGSVEKASAPGTGKLKIDGQVKLMSGGSITSTVEGDSLTYDESLMSEMTVSGVTDKGNTEFSSKNIVTVNGSWTLVAGSNVTVKGKLIVPEGATLKIEAGASLTIANSAVLQIDGNLEIDEADTTASQLAGSLTVTKGEAVVNGNVSISGAIVATDKVTVAQDGVLTIASTGTMSGNGFSVDASGTLEIKGVYNEDVSVRNAGTVVIDSSVPATSKLTISNVLDGAVVDVKKYTMTASVTAGGIEVTDADLVLTTFRDTAAKADVDVVLSGQSNVITIAPGFSNASDAAKVDASVSGITIVSGVSSKKTDDGDNVTAGIYKNKQYSKTMDVSGSIAAAYSVKDGQTLSATTSVNATAAVGMTATGTKAGIAVSGELSLGDNVTLTNSAGTLAVTGTVKAGEKAAFTNGATVKITKGGEVSLVTKILAGTVTATKYVTSEKNSSGTTVYTNHYVDINKALAAASAEGSGIETLTMLYDQTVNADAVVKDGVTLDIGAKKLTIDKADAEITLTVAKGATVKGSGSIVVKDTLYAEDKTNMKVTAVVSDVKTEEVDENGKAVKNGWAKWTNLTVALADATEGAVITVTGDSVTLESNTTVKAGVTLVIPATSYMVLNSGVTLTVDGILKTDGQIYAKGAFDLTAQKVANTAASGAASNAKYSSTVIVNGKLMSGTETVYGNGAISTSKDGSDIDGYTALFKPGTGAPIAGAYYTEGAYYVIAGLETALKDVSVIESDIVIHGKVSVGDISVKGTENLTKIVVKADATTSASITATDKTIGTALTVKSIALDGVTLVIEKDSKSGYFTGSAVIGDAAIAATHATGFEFFAKDSKVLLKGTVDISSDKTDAFGITAGTVYTDEAFAVSVNKNAMTVAAGAAFVAEKTSGTIAALVVDGTLSVPADKQMTVTDLTVAGTVKVDAATSTSASGTLKVTNLYIGMIEKDTTGASAVFNGPAVFDTNAKVLISSDATVDDAFVASLADLKSTKVHVNGAVWFTAYGKGTAAFVLNTVPVENVKLEGWAETEGGEVLKDGNNARLSFDFGDNYNENLYALIDTQVYRIIIKADEGIDNIYLNGQAMYYGLIGVDGNYYYGYTANVAAGSYNVTYTLKNGYSGDAKLSGDNVSGMSFSVSGDYAGDKVYQLSGIEKSGYVDPTPVTPSDDGKDGLTVTDYLLIVLVVLIVIMAVIVAMRLMRS